MSQNKNFKEGLPISKVKQFFKFLIFVSVLFLTRSFWLPPLAIGWEAAKERTLQLLDEHIDLPLSETPDSSVPPPVLTTPEKQTFSISNIEIGATRQTVEANYGAPQRESENEYGVKWSAYHQNYQNFFMVAYDEQDLVRGLYTNQALLASQNDVTFDSDKQMIRNLFGEPEDSIRKGLANYLIQSEGEYDVYHLDNNYVTIFYDLHQDEKITAIQIIEENLELNKNQLYTAASDALKAGFESQLFDLTNASRVKQGLSVLEWSEAASQTGRKHSADMAVNHYFDHTNLAGQSPFDRMKADQITYTTAGENLAYGQTSSIFAHQGLLNSAGHRKNILNPSFAKLGIGVSFNEEQQPYFTELFYA